MLYSSAFMQTRSEHEPYTRLESMTLRVTKRKPLTQRHGGIFISACLSLFAVCLATFADLQGLN